MFRRRVLTVVLTGFATIAGLLVGAPSASAHDTSLGIYLCGSDYNDRCGYGGVTNGHTRLYSCDTNADGYGFRAYYQLRNGRIGYVDDANGSQSGCSAVTPGKTDNPIINFRVVWKHEPGWVYSNWVAS